MTDFSVGTGNAGAGKTSRKAAPSRRAGHSTPHADRNTQRHPPVIARSSSSGCLGSPALHPGFIARLGTQSQAAERGDPRQEPVRHGTEGIATPARHAPEPLRRYPTQSRNCTLPPIRTTNCGGSGKEGERKGRELRATGGAPSAPGPYKLRQRQQLPHQARLAPDARLHVRALQRPVDGVLPVARRQGEVTHHADSGQHRRPLALCRRQAQGRGHQARVDPRTTGRIQPPAPAPQHAAVRKSAQGCSPGLYGRPEAATRLPTGAFDGFRQPPARKRAVTIIGTKSCAKASTRIILWRHQAASGSGRTWAWRCPMSCRSG